MFSVKCRTLAAGPGCITGLVIGSDSAGGLPVGRVGRILQLRSAVGVKVLSSARREIDIEMFEWLWLALIIGE